MLKFFNKKKKLPKRVVIFGASGIISKNLQIELKKSKISYKAIGRKKIDLKNDKSASIKIKKQLKKNDLIIFLSAEAPVKNHKTLLNNIEIMNSIIDGVNPNIISQIIYISSDAVYSDSKSKLSEKSLTLPSNFHGMMHIIREKILKKIFKEKLLILRPTMIYGKFDTHDGYGPNQFLKLVKLKKKIILFGKGEERRDHIYIENIISVLKECIYRKASGTLNLASGNVYSFYEIAKKIIKITNSSSNIKFTKRKGPMPHNGYRPFDISLLKNKFNKLKIDKINSGLKNYIKK
jgi:UDP-glucose 4-epimerase